MSTAAISETGLYGGISGGSYVFEDPGVESDNTNIGTNFVIGGEYGLSRISNVFVQLQQIDNDFESNKSGASFEGFYLKVGYEKKFRGIPGTPWFGGGISSTFGESTNRFGRLPNGFADNDFDSEDKDINAFGAFLSARFKKEMFGGDVVLDFNYGIPVSEGLSGFSYGLGYVYTFGE
jgi:hypothetical protein